MAEICSHRFGVFSCTLIVGHAGPHDDGLGHTWVPDALSSDWLPHIFNDRDFKTTVEMCDKLLTTKSVDYTQGAQGDYGRLKNFYVSGERMGLSPLIVLGVYMNKHLDAINSYIARGRVESEPIEGRICDAINYMLLLSKMVAYEKRKAASEPK